MTAQEALQVKPKDSYWQNIKTTAEKVDKEAVYVTQYGSGTCAWELPSGEVVMVKVDTEP